MCERNYFSLFCKSYLVQVSTFIIGTPILCCTITDLGIFSFFLVLFYGFLEMNLWEHCSAGKGSDMSELRTCAKRFRASLSRLCSDGPRVHLSGPACMPSCIRPEVRLPLDQRVLCSDCCKKSLILYCIAARYVWCLRPKLHIWAACCSDTQMELIV